VLARSHRRVFADKLVSYEDKNWLDKQLFDLMRESFTPDLIRQVRQTLYFGGEGRGWRTEGARGRALVGGCNCVCGRK